jgi:LPS export ABC transporter protein LptC
MPVSPVRRSIAVLVFTGLLFSLAGGCSHESEPAGEKPSAKVPQQVLTGVHLRQTSLKGLLWVLDADEGISYGPDQPMELKNLTVRFYDGGPDVRSTLRSRRGLVDDRTQKLVAQDSVVVETPKGERLETESLHWDPKRQKITTEDRFRFTRGNDVVTGIGISTDPDLTRYSIAREVRAEVRDMKDKELLDETEGDSSGGR